MTTSIRLFILLSSFFVVSLSLMSTASAHYPEDKIWYVCAESTVTEDGYYELWAVVSQPIESPNDYHNHTGALNAFHDAINVERAAMLAAGDPSPPPSMLARLGMG